MFYVSKILMLLALEQKVWITFALTYSRLLPPKVYHKAHQNQRERKATVYW